ncbi:hypothetical protein C7T94_09035 [Pedobacter yulinensis]|uniref:Uncharacterized protein n=1 Tax=Pedobacter yulinensis TaxID=2126353 RepID=A0A2T3HK34_9SPHI|nr:hypothetical protein [Pedobacter yulinensis]PST82779.1 hypothetical protein C7T94_09035 [Pedobacter yulinensis]
MTLKTPLLKLLEKTYEPETIVDLQFARYDLSFKTDEDGRAILLFIGKRGPTGKIRGERFRRVRQADAHGRVIKDYWERKGEATP